MKLNYGRTIRIGLAFMSILAFWQFYDQVIPVILENHFGIDTVRTNMIMALDNVLAIFMLPLFGSLSDKTRTRFGKRTPYVLFGTLAAVCLLCALAYFQTTSMFLGFFLCLLALLVTMSIYRSPAVAYMPDVTPKPLRSKANAVINLVGYLGGIFSTVAMMFLVKSTKTESGGIVYASFVPIMLTVAAFMLVCVLVMVFTTNEPKLLALTRAEVEAAVALPDAPTEQAVLEKTPGLRRSLIFILLSVLFWFTAYNAVTTAFSRFCDARWGVDAGKSSLFLTIGTVAAIVSFLPLGFLSSRIGRKKTILLGIGCMALCYAVIYFLPFGPWMYALFCLIGIGWAAINVNSYPMVVEMCHAKDVGKFTGYYYAFSMAAQIITPVLSGLCIGRTELFGLTLGLNLGYNVLFPYAVFFMCAAFVTMLFVRHGDSKPAPKKGLEAFDTDD